LKLLYRYNNINISCCVRGDWWGETQGNQGRKLWKAAASRQKSLWPAAKR